MPCPGWTSPSRPWTTHRAYHLDIETDDVDAETARLIALGAEQVAQWQACRILRVPGGHLVCVLPVESAPELFQAESNVWP